MASQAIPADFGIKFASSWELQLQQMQSKLAGTFVTDSAIGDGVTERWVKDLTGDFTFVENNGRFGELNATEVTSEDRRLVIRSFESAKKFDKNDRVNLENAYLPQSETMQSLQASWGRRQDQIIMAAISDTVYVSPREAPVATTLPASQTIAVNYVLPGQTAANSGLTPWKIQEALRKLKTAEVDVTVEQPVLVISPAQERDLLVYVSTAPNNVWATMISKYFENPMGGLMGCKVIVSNLLTVASNVRDCLLYTPKGILAAQSKFEFKVDELPTQRHAIQLSVYARFSAIRRWDSRVTIIKCDETP
jgi:hypothetical protein